MEVIWNEKHDMWKCLKHGSIGTVGAHCPQCPLKDNARAFCVC